MTIPNKELQAEIDRLKQALRDKGDRIRALKGALYRYGRHAKKCDVMNWMGNNTCTCGYEEALKGAKP